jgi:hypothetical protein
MQSHLTPSPRIAVPRPILDENRVLDCSYGSYPWDHWQQHAQAWGVPPDLAQLGRAVIREAYQHQWDVRLKSLCGWRDDGQRMMELALRSPGKARRQWNILLRTDGVRGDCRPRSTEWTWGYLRPDAQRLLSSLQTP